MALFVLGWAHARYWLRGTPRPYRIVLFGLTMGVGAVASMIMAVPFEAGLYFDLRASLLVIAAFFGGLPGMLISMSIAGLYRVVLGGAGVVPGLACIGLAGVFGLVLGLVLKSRRLRVPHLLALGLAAGLATLGALLLLPSSTFAAVLGDLAIPVMLLNLCVTPIAGLVHLQARRLAAQRELMSVALARAPDHCYVKDRHGRFVAVNIASARLNGFAGPEDMLGKTDFEITSTERAEVLFQRDQAVLASGKPLVDFQEALTDPDGVVHWYSTTKVPLHDKSGELIGMAGVTRDITGERELQRELRESRDTLSLALAEMSDGLALFNTEGFLVFCNEQYRQSFPYTGAMRQPGVHFKQILQAVVESGEQVNLPAELAEKWLKGHAPQMISENEFEINLFDGRWLLIRTRPTSNGATMVVVSDITRIKQSELELHSTANALKALVLVDGLTGLLNRRAFDDEIDKEIRRSARAANPLSLLLIDVDRFKAYNDRYGHPAGDAVLRSVSDILKTSLKRPADLAVRYGGEEFAAILPDTDEDGAYLVAEAFRKALAEAHIAHEGSERGYLTVSIGVATYMQDNVSRTVAELVQVADDALYSAKAAGRDRVFGKRVPAPGWRYAGSVTPAE